MNEELTRADINWLIRVLDNTVPYQVYDAARDKWWLKKAEVVKKLNTMKKETPRTKPTWHFGTD